MQQKAEAMRDDGLLVWLDMDQKALDDAYDQTVYAPNGAQGTATPPIRVLGTGRLVKSSERGQGIEPC